MQFYYNKVPEAESEWD